ncbi:MAG: DNA-directed RNA polymerase subunit omega [Lachnospiraceae bacterium]|nr:DNA-directed RNA polymerase subunit omega [Lachnospiraceae bacterium]
MMHPSYNELMKEVNSETELGDEPVVSSRYSIVIACAKRARQIIAGDEPLVEGGDSMKPLSAAVEEIYQGKVKVLAIDDEEDVTIDLDSSGQDIMGINLDDQGEPSEYEEEEDEEEDEDQVSEDEEDD